VRQPERHLSPPLLHTPRLACATTLSLPDLTDFPMLFGSPHRPHIHAPTPPTLQLEEVRARYDSAQRRRKQQEPRLLAALRQLVTDEQTAWRQLTEAEHAASELAREQQLAEARGQSG
jgi:hypothetical protein